MLVTRTSMLSGKTHTREINVTQEQIDNWRNGSAVIQEALGHLSADDREFLMTGATPEEWADTFPDE